MKSRLVLQVHDELLVEAYKPELDEVVRIIRLHGKRRRVNGSPDCGHKTGNNWYEAK